MALVRITRLQSNRLLALGAGVDAMRGAIRLSIYLALLIGGTRYWFMFGEVATEGVWSTVANVRAMFV